MPLNVVEGFVEERGRSNRGDELFADRARDQALETARLLECREARVVADGRPDAVLHVPEREADGFSAPSGSSWGTATTGIVLFRPRADLIAVTLLTAYWAWSGLRALRIRHVGPVARDALVSVCALVASVLLVLYLQTVRVPWAPAVIYSTLGTLVPLSLYDLARFAFPARWFETLWLYEHLVKMIGAHSAVITAFSGTVLWRWSPYSQVLSSIVWTAFMITFVIYVRRRTVRKIVIEGRAGRAAPRETMA